LQLLVITHKLVSHAAFILQLLQITILLNSVSQPLCMYREWLIVYINRLNATYNLTRWGLKHEWRPTGRSRMRLRWPISMQDWSACKEFGVYEGLKAGNC